MQSLLQQRTTWKKWILVRGDPWKKFCFFLGVPNLWPNPPTSYIWTYLGREKLFIVKLTGGRRKNNPSYIKGARQKNWPHPLNGKILLSSIWRVPKDEYKKPNFPREIWSGSQAKAQSRMQFDWENRLFHWWNVDIKSREGGKGIAVTPKYFATH